MKRTAVIIVLTATVIVLIGWWFTTRIASPTLFTFYSTNLRSSLFSGSLTLGSFLLAVDTFIIINLKKEVFEHDLYKKRVKTHRKDKPDYQHYGPLRNLSRVLYFTICAAFVSAVLHVTVGMLWPHKVSAVVCISSSLLVAVGVATALVLVARTMRDWFNFLEEASITLESDTDDVSPESKK